MKKSKKVCKNCKWFDPYYEEGGILLSGDCERFPPVWTAPPVNWASDDVGALVNAGNWNVPHVGKLHRCGEWRKKK